MLKNTGSIYLHCDPTASHYLKALMDSIFGPGNFRNELIWKRTTAHSDSRTHFSRVTDTILFYACSDEAGWIPQYEPHSESYLKSHYSHRDAAGRVYRLDNIIRSQIMGLRPNLTYEYKGFTPPYGWRVVREKLEIIDRDGRLYWSKNKTPYLVRYLDQQSGEILDNLWADIPPVNSQAKERLGYPTQKPLALLERIIQASSNPGDIVLDPFCGCGTAVHAAQKLSRQWIGIDITWLAIALVRRRMQDAFPGLHVEEIGSPVDLTGARALAAAKPAQFEYWVIDRLDALPTGGKGPQLDGVKPFMEFGAVGGVVKYAIVSVKGQQKAAPEMVREVQGVLNDDNPIGVLATLAEPTKGMKTQAASAGFYESSGRKYARMQIISVADMLKGARIDLPSHASPYAKAPSEPQTEGTQANLDLSQA